MSHNPEHISLALFISAFDSLPIPVLIEDRQGIVRWVNAALAALTGYRAEELVGQPVALLGLGIGDCSFLILQGAA
jgi:PAS domain S-box-containing protein